MTTRPDTVSPWNYLRCRIQGFGGVDQEPTPHGLHFRTASRLWIDGVRMIPEKPILAIDLPVYMTRRNHIEAGKAFNLQLL